MNKKKIIILSIVLAVAVAAASTGSFYAGFKMGEKTPQTLTIKGVTNLGPDEGVAIDFSIFWEAWQKLRDRHIKGAEMKNQDMLYGAISGLADSFGDPNTTFFKPEDSKKFEEDVGGSFGGIGAEIGLKKEQLIIVAPMEDSPAEKAGLRAGDKILAINGESTAGIDVDEGVKKIRGEIGTNVTLTISREGEEKTRDITITRQLIEIPTLKLEIKDGNIAYLRLNSFNENAPFLFYKAALNMLYRDVNGIVLDLRNNPGGFLEVSINLAGWFLERGEVVVTEKFRNGDDQVFLANGASALKDLPLVILINKGSASASEILAGSLRDQRGVKLIGEKSFGKGTVQELFNLKDRSTIKITIANWLLPSGQTIEENGLTPDVEVLLTEKDIEAKKDPQLEKALEILKAQIAG